MNNLMTSFLKDETAATAIEYGLIAASISGGNHRRRERTRHEAHFSLRVGYKQQK